MKTLNDVWPALTSAGSSWPSTSGVGMGDDEVENPVDVALPFGFAR